MLDPLRAHVAVVLVYNNLDDQLRSLIGRGYRRSSCSAAELYCLHRPWHSASGRRVAIVLVEWLNS